VTLVRSLPLPQFLPQIISSGHGTACDTWRITVLHHKEYFKMGDMLKFTDRFEEILRIPRKLKGKVFGKDGSDPLTHFRYQNEKMTRDGTTKTTIEDEDEDHRS
jgi:hypothetical protein